MTAVDKLWTAATRSAFEYAAPSPRHNGSASKGSGTGSRTQRGSADAPAPNLVSVCVTVFNYERYLVGCLDSIKAQTHPELELIVVDDASEADNSVEAAVKWARRHKDRFRRVSIQSHCRNQGPAEARNTAFRLARGEHVFIIDADNEIYPRAIARLHEAALSGEFDATYSQIERFGAEQGIGSADIWDAAEMLQTNYVDVMSLLRRDAWERVGGFSHVEAGWEDYDFWLKFIDAGLKAAYVPEILCRYRVHDKSRTATEAFRAHDELRVLMAFRHPRFGTDAGTELGVREDARRAESNGSAKPASQRRVGSGRSRLAVRRANGSQRPHDPPTRPV